MRGKLAKKFRKAAMRIATHNHKETSTTQKVIYTGELDIDGLPKKTIVTKYQSIYARDSYRKIYQTLKKSWVRGIGLK